MGESDEHNAMVFGLNFEGTVVRVREIGCGSVGRLFGVLLG